MADPEPTSKSPFQRIYGVLQQPPVLRTWMISILVICAVLAGLTAFLVVRGMVFPWTLSDGAGKAQPDQPALNAAGTPLPAIPASSGPDLQVALAPWDGAGRVTVLVMGLDYRDWEAGDGPARSDTMLLLTLDPLAKTAGILSIPRDLWVGIPGFKHGKINTAYFLGEAYKLPGGGPGLAVRTVEQTLGVPIHYYAQIDFGAFVKFIDELGGVKIDVPEKITVDLLGAGKGSKKTLKPGPQVLPGEWALAYARARYTEGGDFDRANRQQQVILAIRDKVLSLNMLPTLITKAPTLYSELAGGIHTNLSLDQILKLAALAQQVPSENIQRGMIGKDQTIFGQSPDKLSILIPIPDKINLVRDQIFAASGTLSPQTAGDALQRMQAEAARLAILNGSNSSGLEKQAAEALKKQGVHVSQMGAASRASGSTTLIDHSGSPYLLSYLLTTLNLSPANVVMRFDPAAPVDVELILGNDAPQRLKGLQP